MQVLRHRNGLGAVSQDLVGAANVLQQQKEDANAWPYFWRQPRAFTQSVPRIKSIPTPAPTVNTLITSVSVPAGYNFILAGVLHGFNSSVGGASVWTPGSGDILWTVDVNVPIDAVAVSGYGLPDLSAMAEQRGSLELGPFPLDGYNVFGPYDVIRYKVVTTANIPEGGGNFIFAGLIGWFDKQ